MDILPPLAKEAEQIIDPAVPPLVEIETPLITSPENNGNPKATPGVRISSQMIVHTKQY